MSVRNLLNCGKSMHSMDGRQILPAQSCSTICDPMDPPGSSVHGLLQARILSALPFSPSGDLPDLGVEPCVFSFGRQIFYPCSTWVNIRIYPAWKHHSLVG